MHETNLILTLTAGLLAALIFGYVTHRLSLWPIVGYLLAGIVVGPATPGFVANKPLADEMAEIGVILLMFGVGIAFSRQRPHRRAPRRCPGARTEFGCYAARLLRWIQFRLALVCWRRIRNRNFNRQHGRHAAVLANNNDLHTTTGRIAVGWLVVEDLFSVLVLVLLPVVFHRDAASPANVAIALIGSLLKIGLLVAFVFYVGGRIIPWVLAVAPKRGPASCSTLTVLVVALGIAVGATNFFGVSPALGAFLAGMVVGQSEFSSRAASEALPMRDAFAVVFFVSVGMLFDPSYLVQSPQPVLASLAIIMLANPLTAFAILVALRYPLRVAAYRSPSLLDKSASSHLFWHLKGARARDSP